MLEGTVMSVGRGTDWPFQVYGHPQLHTPFHFTPTPRHGAEWPELNKKLCYGWNLVGSQQAVLGTVQKKLQIKYLLNAYHAFPNKKHFFAGFNSVSGNDELAQQIQSGMSERQIRLSWQTQLLEFKEIRRKYLLYPDFE
jgi:uncharacterized protein YbbC (DUF1343 family)